MNETLITDLVAQQALDQLDELDRKMEGTLTQFQDCARELARGIKIPVEVTGDLERLRELANATMQRAGQAAQQYTQQLQQQQQVIANTTNTISRQLMEQEKLNKANREAFTQNQEALRIAEQIVGTYEENTRKLARYTAELARNKAQLKEVENQRKSGLITDAQALQRSADLMAEQNKLKAAMQEVASVVRVQAKEMNAAEGSYVHLSQQLELLKKAQKGLNEDEKAGEEGKALEAEIQNLDARLKDLAADMGEFQRNVGNYAIAQGGLKKSYGELQEVLTGLTIQYREMDDAQRESEEGQALKEQIDALTEKAATFRAAMEEVNAAVANSAAGQQITRLTFELTAMANEYGRMSEAEKESARGSELSQKMTDLTQKIATLKGEVDAVAADAAPQTLKTQYRELKNQIASLEQAYRDMTDAERESADGEALKRQIAELTEKAGELKDTIGDVNEAIENAASDTRLFDTLSEFGQVVSDTFGLCTSAAQAFGLSQEQLNVVMAKVQGTMQASQALERMAQVTQKQSSLMRGIAILQRKAEAAAINMKTAAEGKGIIATKAATVAQAAFNAVANANPYVLLAMAVLTVVGALVAFSKGSEEASEASKKAAEAAEAHKKSMENFAQSYGNSAGEAIAKYQKMRAEWNALANDLDAKKKYLENNKKALNEYAVAADGAGASVKGVNDVERIMNQKTDTVVAALKKRAQAVAAYAEYVRVCQQELQELEKLSTFTYTPAKSGQKAGVAWVGGGSKGGTAAAAGFSNDEWSKLDKQRHGYWEGGEFFLNDEGSQFITNMRRQAGNANALAEQQKVKDRYAKEKDYYWSRFEKNGGLDPANFEGAGDGTTKQTPKTSPKSSEQVKNAEEIKKLVDDIMYDSYQRTAKLAEDGTDKWLAEERKAIEQKRDMDIAAAEKRRDDLIEEVEKTAKKEGWSAEQVGQLRSTIETETDNIITSIRDQATEDIKSAEDEVVKHKQELAQKEIEQAMSRSEAEQVMLDAQYANELEKLKEKYAQELAEVESNEEKIAEVKKRYQEQTARLSEQYAIKTAKAQYDMVIKQLAAIGAVDEDMIVELTEMVKNGELDAAASILEAYGLTHDQAMELLKSLADAEIGTRTATTDAAIALIERERMTRQEAAKEEEDAHQKKMQNLQDWVQKAGQAIEKISGFVTALYDNQIAKIDELLEAEQEHYDKQVEEIEYLAEIGAITAEEAEARKRVAAQETERKQEELEKKKASIEYKKAVMEKANAIAQIAINTALGIMQTYAQLGWPTGIPGAIFIGAMGAIQMATALAQPIKAYAEGTQGKPHPGGLALVGDGDKAELVLYNGKAWVTPDSPTLVDLPKGAEVLPDAERVALMSAVANIPRDRVTGAPIIINDYSALESRVAGNTKAVTRELRGFRIDMARRLKRQKFDAYIARRI